MAFICNYCFAFVTNTWACIVKPADSHVQFSSGAFCEDLCKIEASNTKLRTNMKSHQNLLQSSKANTSKNNMVARLMAVDFQPL